MNEFLAKANSVPMYLICGLVVGFVLIQAIVFLIKAWREGLRIGMKKEVLKKVMFSSATFSLVPSFAILVGLLALAPALGLPLPWMRLSVIGALHYEGPTANNIAKGIGLGELPSELITGGDFAAIAFAMTVGIIWGMVFIIFFFRFYQKKIKVVTGKDPKLFNILFCALFMGMVSAYVGDAFSKIRQMTLSSGIVRTPNILPIITVVVSALVMAFFTWLIEKKKIKWLENFAFSFAMLAGMMAAVLGQFVFPSLSSFVE